MTVIQSSNGLPRMDGDKGAIDRRFRIIPFTKKFKSKPDKAIRDDYINRREVLEYILKLVLDTPVKDINPKKSQDLLDDYQKEMNPVLNFASEFFTDELHSEFLPNSFIWHVWGFFLDYYGYTSIKKENALHRELKNNLPAGFEAGIRTIPQNREQHLGFYPNDDLPPYASRTYSNGRERPEKRVKPKQEKGYYNRRRKL